MLQIRKHMHSSKPQCNLGLFTELYILNGSQERTHSIFSFQVILTGIRYIYSITTKVCGKIKYLLKITHIICHLHFKINMSFYTIKIL